MSDKPDSTDLNKKKSNLFKKGQSGNPAGKPATTQIVKQLQIEGKEAVIKEAFTLLNLTREELKNILIQDKHNAIEHPYLRILLARSFLKTKTFWELDQILNRLIGRPTEEVNVNNKNMNIHTQLVDLMAELSKSNLKDVQQDIKKGEIEDGSEKEKT